MLMIVVLAVIIAATFWFLSSNKEAKKIWAVTLLALIAMMCYILFFPLM